MGAAAKIEKGEGETEMTVKVVKHLSDINLQLPEAVRQDINAHRKRSASAATFSPP